MAKAGRCSLSGISWQAEFSVQSDTVMKFRGNGCQLHLMPLELNNISEGYGLLQKLQPHHSADGLRRSLNLELVIPFGAEPRLRRDIAFAANHATVSSYIELKGNLALSQLNIDPLFLPGDWQRVGIVEIPTAGDGIAPPRWHSLQPGTAEQLIYRSPRPFLICLLENRAGGTIEIGTGDDLWRWQAAAAMPELTAEFSIVARPEGVTINRKVFHAATPVVMENRPWRFKWYFAWGNASTAVPSPPEQSDIQPFAFNAKFSKTGGKNSFFDFTHPKLGEHSAIVNHNGETGQYLCFKAGAVNKALRKFIRSAAQHCPHDELIFVGLEPHCCASARHLERPKKRFLSHWDMMSIMDFYDWANRQLLKNGRCLRLQLPRQSPLHQFPSLAGMALKSVPAVMDE